MVTISTSRNFSPSQTITVYPKTYKYSIFSVNDPNSGRSLDGTMFTNRRTQKRKLELSIAGLSWNEASTILSMVNSEHVYVRFPDFVTGSIQQAEFYPGDRSGDAFIWTDDKKITSEIAFNLIEV